MKRKQKEFLDAYSERENGGFLSVCRRLKLTSSDVEKWLLEDSDFAARLQAINKLRVARVKIMLADNLERVADAVLEEALTGKSKIQAAKVIFGIVDPPETKKKKRDEEQEPEPEPLADADELRNILGAG